MFKLRLSLTYSMVVCECVCMSEDFGELNILHTASTATEGKQKVV